MANELIIFDYEEYIEEELFSKLIGCYLETPDATKAFESLYNSCFEYSKDVPTLDELEESVVEHNYEIFSQAADFMINNDEECQRQLQEETEEDERNELFNEMFDEAVEYYSEREGFSYTDYSSIVEQMCKNLGLGVREDASSIDRNKLSFGMNQNEYIYINMAQNKINNFWHDKMCEMLQIDREMSIRFSE